MSGLQCWDGSGNIVVDLGDYSVRFIGLYGVNIPSGANYAEIPVHDISQANGFCIPVVSGYDGTLDSIYIVCYNNYVRAVNTSGSGRQISFTFEAYTYI